MNTYTLVNDFHGTSVNVRCAGVQHIWNEVEITLSENQTKRAKKALCGIAGCTCSNAAGMRGAQTHHNYQGRTIKLRVSFPE